MVLKRLFLCYTGKPQLHIHCLAVWLYRALSQYNRFSGKMVFKRLCISFTGEASAHSLFRSPWRQTSHPVSKIGLLKRCSHKGHSLLALEKLCKFIQVSQETEVIELIQLNYLEDGLVKSIHH